ncbi:MAG: SPOR domain-containing protein [Bacteroidia bacterium]
MKTDQHIAALLYDHDCVVISDFGGFVASYQPAQRNDQQQTFYPPSKKIAFNAGLRNNDGLLAHRIAARENISYSDACKIIFEFVSECFQTLDNGKKLHFDNIGLLFYDAEKNIQFIPDPYQSFLKDSFGLTMIHAPAFIKQEETFPVRELVFTPKKKHTKFNWRVVELIPAAAMIALMFTFPMITKNFDSQLSSLNPFANHITIDTVGYPRKIFIKEKSSADAVFNKPPAEKILTDSVAPAPPTKVEIAEPKPEAPEDISPKPNNTEVNETVSTISKPKAEPPSVAAVHEINKAVEFEYNIIGGCFSIEENAANFRADLRSKGYDAEIIGKNNAGLTMVSISSFDDLSEAKSALQEIKGSINSGAWIFRKK